MTEFNLEEFKNGDFKIKIYNNEQYIDFCKIIKIDSVKIDWNICDYLILRVIENKLITSECVNSLNWGNFHIDKVIDFETLTFDSFYKDPDKDISPIHVYDILDDKFTELLQDGVISTKEFTTMLECLMMLGGKK